MGQFARHALVEFAPDWAIRSWHCVMCAFSTSKGDELIEHVGHHLVKKATTSLSTKATKEDGTELQHTNTYMLHEQGIVKLLHMNYSRGFISCPLLAGSIEMAGVAVSSNVLLLYHVWKSCSI